MIPYMNHGRWVIDCPSLDCGGAEKLSPPQATVICSCRDQSFCQHDPICGTIIELDWPADRLKIEAAVATRHMTNRNWQPGESVDELVEENAAHGLDRS